MKTTPALLRRVVMLVTLAVLPAAFAADTPAPAPTPAPVKRPTISIDFPGGSVSKFVAALPKADAASISILGEPAEMATELPAFSLRNADPMAVIQSLSNLLRVRNLNLAVTGANPDGVVATINRQGPAPKGDATAFESFQLAPFLGTQSVDDIVGAIRIAWELDPSHEKEALRIKFHPPTSILLVSGPGPAIDTAKNVLGSLRRNPEDSPELKTPRAKP